MKAIFKYPFQVNNVVEIELPYNSKVLSIQPQEDKGLMLWAMIDLEERGTGKRRFYVFGTGQQINETVKSMNHVATVQDLGFVWHIFE